MIRAHETASAPVFCSNNADKYSNRNVYMWMWRMCGGSYKYRAQRAFHEAAAVRWGCVKSTIQWIIDNRLPSYRWLVRYSCKALFRGQNYLSCHWNDSFWFNSQLSPEDLAQVPVNSTSNILNRLMVSYDPRIRPNFQGKLGQETKSNWVTVHWTKTSNVLTCKQTAEGLHININIWFHAEYYRPVNQKKTFSSPFVKQIWDAD